MSGRDIHRKIFDRLEDGVLVMRLGGRIETLKPAAEHIPGKSTRLRIAPGDNPKVLPVPIDALESRGSTHRVQVVDPATVAIEDRTVEIGPTARKSVKILAGLEPGDTILAWGG